MRKLSAVLICGLTCALCAPAQNVARAATADQQFVTLAAQTDMTEAHLGQLAVEHASSQTVKDYAQMLMTDHTSDYDKISALARKSGLMVPTGLDSDHNKKIAPFEKLKGVAFDKRFAHDMFSGHEAATAAYDKESREGQNADLKKYAKDTLPTLEKHKDGAKQLIK